MGEDGGFGNIGKDESDLSCKCSLTNEAKIDPLDILDHTDVVSVFRDNCGLLGNKNIRYSLIARLYTQLGKETTVDIYIKTIGLLNPEKIKERGYRKAFKNLPKSVRMGLDQDYNALISERKSS